MKKYNVAVVGAAGMVGGKILDILEERNFPIENLKGLDQKEMAGEKFSFNNKDYTYEELTEDSLDNLDFVFFAAGGGVSEKYAKLAASKGAKVIDNSSFFRMDEDIPLVIPEVNPEVVTNDTNLIANPNCSTIQSIVALKPLYDAFGLKRVIYNTYQAVSGSGVAGIKDLKEGTCDNYPYSITNNTLPHIDDFTENGYTKEEMKMINETHKILDDDTIKITATTVRVPIENSHAVSMNIEFEKEFDLDEVFEVLQNAPGVVVKDNLDKIEYPIQEDTNGKDEVYIGRIRRDFSVDNGINLWCMADNIRKGAATNSVQIAELFI